MRLKCVFLLLLLLFTTSSALVGKYPLISHHHALKEQYMKRFMTSSKDKYRSFREVLTRVQVEGNTTSTLLNLIKLGDEYLASSLPEATLNKSFYKKYKSHWQRVPGCMADARIYTSLKGDKIAVVGVADSRVAQGLIALFALALRNENVVDALQLSGEALTNACELDSVLPPGRLNGLHNMLNVIQDQLRRIGSGVRAKPETRVGNDERSMHWKGDEIAVLVSGGVDSSVALKLLVEQGHKVRGFYLKIWLEDEVAHLNECPWEEDLFYAQRVCDQLGVPLETVSLQKEYWDEVVQYTFDEARLGRTPNPDIMCNSRIKFGMFYEYIGRHFRKVATGHYAQVRIIPERDGQAELFMSPDPIKDQTYFLCNLRQDQLKRALFPIGHLHKAEVRQLAESFGLVTEKRKDSQGICFLGKLKFDDFIAHYLGETPGPIREYRTERVLGEHRGLWFHTIGQRKGVGTMLGRGVVNDGPWYVCAKDPETNSLYITNDISIVDKPRKEFVVDRINWISPNVVAAVLDGTPVDIRLRHGQAMASGVLVRDAAYLLPLSEGTSTERARVVLDKHDKGIAPGQFAAFYRNGVCLGAGVISETGTDK